MKESCRLTATSISEIRHYIGAIEYVDGAVEAINFGNGRIVLKDEQAELQYTFKDHLGNTVVLFSDINKDGDLTVTNGADSEVLKRDFYYPFGLQMEGCWQPPVIDIGLAATLIHEAGHANILAEQPFWEVAEPDHHVPFQNQLFNNTLEGLKEYNASNKLGYSPRDLKLLAANGLWGTDEVIKAFGLDRTSENYDSKLNKLKQESKALFKGK